MERESVDSSNISSIGYDEEQQLLEIEFLNGAIYQYTDVPLDVYNNLMNASSHGSYLAHNIKGTYQYNQIG